MPEVAAQISAPLAPPPQYDIDDFRLADNTKLPSKSNAGWNASKWLPTLLAIIAIVVCGIQISASRRSAIALSKELTALTLRLEIAQKDVVDLQVTIAQLQQDAGEKDIAGDTGRILTGRLWRAQDAIDDNAAQIAGIIGALDNRQHRRTISERRIFESPEAEEEAKQIATVFKKIADAERERERAEARKNAVKK